MPLICRLCLKTNLENYTSIGIDDIRIKILSIIPEIDVDVVDKPVICSDCSDVLTTAYSFKQNCLKIEERINMYTGNVVRKIILEQFLELHNHSENKLQVKEEKPADILYALDCKALPEDVSNENNTVDIESIKIKQNPREVAVEKTVGQVKEENLEEIFYRLDCETLLQDVSNEDNTVNVETVKNEDNCRNTTIEKTVCKFCNKSIIRTGKRWIYHIGKHITSKYICFICCEGFESKSEYDTHKTEKHRRISGTSRCDICNKDFSSKANMKRHLHMHKKKKSTPFQCDVCGLKVKQYAILQTHLRTHNGERPFKCKLCEKAFAQSSTLSTHVKYVHMTDRPYICEFCGKTFATKGDCTNHSRVHKDIEKNYVCSICGKAYHVPNKLKVHMKRHNGVKDYICKICSKGFVDSNGLRRHMRMHNQDKPFECHLCHKRFTQSYNRKIHVKSCMQRNPAFEVDVATADK